MISGAGGTGNNRLNEDDGMQPQFIQKSLNTNNNNQGTKMMDTMGIKITDTVALVCLGDSRGYVHMNHLILK